MNAFPLNPLARIAVFGVLIATAFGVQTQPIASDDILMGTWELMPEISTFIDREEPQSQTRIYTPHPLGLQVRIISVDQYGVRTEAGFTGSEDGTANPTYGVSSADEITLNRTGPRRAEATFTHAGQEVGGAIREISLDGQEMTVSLTVNGDLVSRMHYRKVN